MFKLKLSDKDIDRIAEAVVEKIILKQQDIDKVYYQNAPPFVDQSQLSHEMLTQNFIGLKMLLNEYIKNEDYEKAGIAQLKLDEIKKLLEKFK